MRRGARFSGAVCGIAAAVLAVLAFVLRPDAAADPLWHGYRVLLVDDAVPESEVLAALFTAGFSSVVSESTQPVVISDYEKLAVTTLKEAQRRLVAGDPRADSYLARLVQYFHAEGIGADGAAQRYRVYYLVGEGGGNLKRALTPFDGRYVLPEGRYAPSPVLRWGLVSVFALAATLLVLVRRRGRRARLALLGPLASLALSGLEGAVAALLATAFFAVAAERFEAAEDELALARKRKDSLSPHILLLRALRRGTASPGVGALAVPFAGYLALHPSLMPAAISASCAAALSYASCALLARRAGASAPHGARHPTFRPLPILSAAPLRASRNDRLVRCAAIVGATAVILGFGLARDVRPWRDAEQAQGSGIMLPRPERVAGSARPDPEEATRRIAVRTADELPGLAEWLAHRAYQEALFYIPLGDKRTEAFAPLAIPLPKGKSVAGPVFDGAWARNAYRTLKPQSVEGMVLAQGGYVRIRLAGTAHRTKQPLAPIKTLLYIILLAPPLYGALAGLPRARRAAALERAKAA